MARVHGKNGRIYLGIASAAASAELLPNMKSWSANFSTDVVDVTAFADANKVFVAGLPQAGGSFDGWWDDVSLQTYTGAVDGIARKIYMYPTTPAATGPYWYGTAFVDFSIEVPVDGANNVKVTWSPATAITRVG